MLRSLLVSISALFVATPALSEVTATQFAEKELVTISSTGETQTRRVTADVVAPGEEIIYTLRFSNDSSAPADNITLVMPVPAEISYVEGSVTGAATRIAYSADGGQTYVPRGRLTVVEEGFERPARGDEITHIRWSLVGALPAGATGEVSFRGVIR